MRGVIASHCILERIGMEIVLGLKADALYIKFQNGKFARNRKIDGDMIIDLDNKGKLLGIEMLNVTKRAPIKNLSDASVKLPLKISSH